MRAGEPTTRLARLGMKNFLRNLNWWSVTAVWFTVLMFLLLAAPSWAQEWAFACGFTAIVASVFALGSASLPGPRR